MKTNVNMIRKMGNFDVSQRIKDSFFNATDLLKQWNKYSNQKKRIFDFFENINTKEFIKELENNEDLHVPNITHVKSKASRGINAGTWMTPILFIKFAMWLNVKFEIQVIKFVYDQLIDLRHDAGDNYNGLTSAVQRFNGINYPQLAKGLNYIIFGRHEKGIRQNASVKQLKELTNLQVKLAFAVDMGYIKSFDELINEMRRLYKSRNLELY